MSNTSNGGTWCPANDATCPYYHKGICHIENPAEDCDDYQTFMDCYEEDAE